ncbi:MAG: glutathione S-transferase N-terminal domain-containing protein [Hyphomicrobiales bacterium]|nr:glutathione S-transferase N-terminal domain-containing protein [Hyphomicrobiales bacterium]
MKLLYSHTSPYARKVRIALREKGALAGVEEVVVNPWGDDVAELRAQNPLGKIPALVLDDGQAYFDSRVICAYIDSLAPEPALTPKSSPALFAAMRAEALADGVLDASVAMLLESRRPEPQRSPDMIARWRAAIERSVPVMAEAEHALPADARLARIAIAVALGHVDYRHGHIRWRDAAPRLAGWHQEYSARPSFVETAPPPA